MFGLFASSRGSNEVSRSNEAPSKKEEPPPVGSPSNKYEEIDANFIHLFFDSETGEDYYHAMALGRLLIKDYRLSSFKFSLKVHSFGGSLSSGFAKLTNEQCASANFANFLRPEVLAQIGSGDIVIAVGAQKMLKAFRDVASEHPQTFFYFGTTSSFRIDKNHHHFDLFAMPRESFNPDDLDDDDVFVIRQKTAFPFKLRGDELERPVEHSPYDYNFVILPHIEVFSDFDKVIKGQMKEVFSCIGLQFLRGLSEKSKLVVLSGQNPAKLNVERIKERIHEELSNIIQYFKQKKILGHGEARRLESFNRKMPVNFLHQDYISSNKIPQVVRRVLHCPQARIFLPFQSISEVLFLRENGVSPRQIFAFNYIKGNGLELGYMHLDEANLAALEALAFFSDAELAEQKRKFPERLEFIKNVAESDANEIVIMYVEESPHLSSEEKDELLNGEEEELAEPEEEDFADEDEEEKEDELENENEENKEKDKKQEQDLEEGPSDELTDEQVREAEEDLNAEEVLDVEEAANEAFNEDAKENLEDDLAASLKNDDLNLDSEKEAGDVPHIDFSSMAEEPEEHHLAGVEKGAEVEESHHFRDVVNSKEDEAPERGR